jgi:hypothetical protein
MDVRYVCGASPTDWPKCRRARVFEGENYVNAGERVLNGRPVLTEARWPNPALVNS